MKTCGICKCPKDCGTNGFCDTRSGNCVCKPGVYYFIFFFFNA